MDKYVITLSANVGIPTLTGLSFKQGDKGMMFNFHILGIDDSGAPKIVFKRANGTSVESDDVTGSDGSYSYVVKGNEFEVPGKTVADLKFYNGTTGRTSTASFVFAVEADTLDGIGKGTSGYSDTLEKLVEEGEKAKSDFEFGTAQAQIYAEIAEEAAERAMSATPEGYANVVDTVDKLVVKNTELGTSHSVITSQGGIVLNSVVGNSVKDGNVIHSSAEMGLVDLGELEWYWMGWNCWKTSIPNNIKLPSWDGEKPNAYSEYYPVKAVDSSYSSSDVCVFYNANGLYVRNGSTTEKPVGKLAYELAEGSTADKYGLVFNEHGQNLLDVNDYVNTNTDTRQFQIQFFAKKNGITQYKVLATEFLGVGLYSITVDLTEGVDGLYLKHNGSQLDLLIFNKDIYLKGIYTFSMNVVSANPSVVGGLKIDNFQLEEGSTATQYVPYQSKTLIIPIKSPFYSVNDVHDEFQKRDGKWGVLRRFGSVALNVLTWAYNDVGIRYAPIPTKKNGNHNVLCNKYTTSSTIAWNDGHFENMQIMGDNSNYYIFVRDTSLPSTEKPVGNVIYELATPIFEPLEDQSSMYQLESYDGTTTIASDGYTMFSVSYGKNSTSAKALLGVNADGIAKSNKDLIDDTQTIISDAWVSNKTYSVGSYVIWQNALYRCLVQNVGQLPSDGNYWVKCTIASELGKIKTGAFEVQTVVGVKQITQNELLSGSLPNSLWSFFTIVSDWSTTNHTTNIFYNGAVSSLYIKSDVAQRVGITWISIN